MRPMRRPSASRAARAPGSRSTSGSAGRSLRRLLSHARGGAAQTRLRVDQELSGHDDLLPGFESLVNFRLAVAFDADRDIHGSKAAIFARDDDHGAPAGLN